MANYTIRPLNKDGSVSSSSDARCATDQDALDLAQRLATLGHICEVWSEGRLVGRVRQATGNEIIQQGRRWNTKADRLGE